MNSPLRLLLEDQIRMKRLFEVGDQVMLMFGPLCARLGVTPELSKMEERVFTISKVKFVHNFTIYELDGCVSKKGMPFTISRDWMIPYREARR